jgi:uncharacterized protein YbdZ (MbtH family)
MGNGGSSFENRIDRAGPAMTSDDSRGDDALHRVVINHEEQYSIWLADRPIPAGWRDAGKIGLKADCLAYINEVWTDMRPLSLRQQMESDAQRPPQQPLRYEHGEPETLIDRLSHGRHPVVVPVWPESSVAAFKECLERGYVLVKFTDTRGGTEVGLRLDAGACDLAAADFTAARGSVHLEGEVVLDDVNIRCLADVGLETLSGLGQFAVVSRRRPPTVL